MACGLLLGAGIDRAWHSAVIPAEAAQQRGQGQQRPQPSQQPQAPRPQPTAAAPQAPRPEPLPTMESLPAEVAQLKALVPSNSHIMMDVQFHWTNLWWAGRRRNWPLALYYFNETRGHMQWLIRKSPMIRSQLDQKDVDISGIFDGIDTSSLAAVKAAIEHKDGAQFASSYRTMLESCYSCHKSVGRAYLRPMIPTQQTQAILNMDPSATWPE